MNEIRPPRLAGVICDLDGTLVDSEPLHARAWTEVLCARGLTLADDWFVPWVGIPDTKLSVHLAQTSGLTAEPAALLAEKRERYQQLAGSALRAFPGVAEALNALARAGLGLAVATSSEHADAERALAAAGLRDRFAALIGADDVTRHKPDPEPYRSAALRLGLEPTECAAVEDSPIGLASAVAAGCFTVGVTTTHAAERLAGARRLFAQPAEAFTWLIAAGQAG